MASYENSNERLDTRSASPLYNSKLKRFRRKLCGQIPLKVCPYRVEDLLNEKI